MQYKHQDSVVPTDLGTRNSTRTIFFFYLSFSTERGRANVFRGSQKHFFHLNVNDFVYNTKTGTGSIA